jgi:hypothetical protein
MADAERREHVLDRLTAILTTSELSDIAMTSAALRALLDVLEASGVSRREAQAAIARTLNAFLEDEG